MKTLFLLALILAMGCAGVAQNRPPDVVFHAKCEKILPSLEEWVEQTRLPYGKPYVAPEKRKATILESYSKLKLNMPLEDAEKLLGKPDFALAVPRARLATEPEPERPRCRNQVVYLFEKNSVNLIDMADVGVYLFFDEDGRLYWATTQNVPNLKELGSPEGKIQSTEVRRQSVLRR